MLLRGQASVELCHVIERGQVLQRKPASKIAPRTAKKWKGKDNAKQGSSGSESEHEKMTMETEGEEWNPHPDKDRMQDDLPVFEIRPPDVSMEDIPTEDGLDSTLRNSLRGTKRKRDQRLESPTPEFVSHSSISSRKKRHKDSSEST